MKKTLLALAFSAALLSGAAGAQQYYNDYDDGYDYDYDGVGWDYYDDYAPGTGDASLDAMLLALNAVFGNEPEYYSQQIVYETRLEPRIVEEYVVQRRYAPADVYMIGELAQASGKSFADVARVYDANRAQGWGATARSLGIKPGSAQFHALKNGGTVIVERGKGRGRANAPGQQRRATVVQTGGRIDAAPARGQAQGHPGRGHGNDKAKGNGKGQGKGGKGKGKDKDK